MGIEKIYLDMDGVLADFDRGIRELCGAEPADQNNSTEEEDARVFAAVRSQEHFFRRLEPVPGAKDLFDTLYAAYGDRVEILTGVPSPRRNLPEAGEDKVIWVREHLSETVKVNLVRRVEKKNFCTGKNCVLIDDLENNIVAWKQHGGTGILYKNAKQAMEELKKLGF